MSVDLAVLDVSASMRILLATHSKDHDILKSCERVISPSIYLFELGNACWKYHQFETWPWEIVANLYLKGSLLPEIIEFTPEKYIETLQIALEYGVTFYDSAYLQLASSTNATLISSDRKLLQKASEIEVKTIKFS